MAYSANNCRDFTPSDTVDDPLGPSRAVHCNVSGNATVLFDGDKVAQTLAFVAGLLYPYRIKRVNLTGLTATLKWTQ